MLVFNFHHVEQQIRHLDRKHISISPKGLERFIWTLRLAGFEIISLRDAMAEGALEKQHQRKVVLTFDDGYENNLREALPVLEAMRCPATVFVLPGRLGGTNAWDQGHLPEADRDQLMTLDEMKTLANSPYITLGSHGLLHEDFNQLSEADLSHEIHASYNWLLETFDDAFLPVLAYPWGYYSPKVIAAMEKSAYKYAFTVETMPWQAHCQPFQIPRFSAFYRDGNPLILLAKLLRHSLKR